MCTGVKTVKNLYVAFCDAAALIAAFICGLALLMCENSAPMMMQTMQRPVQRSVKASRYQVRRVGLQWNEMG